MKRICTLISLFILSGYMIAQTQDSTLTFIVKKPQLKFEVIQVSLNSKLSTKALINNDKKEVDLLDPTFAGGRALFIDLFKNNFAVVNSNKEKKGYITITFEVSKFDQISNVSFSNNADITVIPEVTSTLENIRVICPGRLYGNPVDVVCRLRIKYQIVNS